MGNYPQLHHHLMKERLCSFLVLLLSNFNFCMRYGACFFNLTSFFLQFICAFDLILWKEDSNLCLWFTSSKTSYVFVCGQQLCLIPCFLLAFIFQHLVFDVIVHYLQWLISIHTSCKVLNLIVNFVIMFYTLNQHQFVNLYINGIFYGNNLQFKISHCDAFRNVQVNGMMTNGDKETPTHKKNYINNLLSMIKIVNVAHQPIQDHHRSSRSSIRYRGILTNGWFMICNSFKVTHENFLGNHIIILSLGNNFLAIDRHLANYCLDFLFSPLHLVMLVKP